MVSAFEGADVGISGIILGNRDYYLWYRRQLFKEQSIAYEHAESVR